MRSDNLRPAPNFITPELVGQLLKLSIPTGGPTPVATYPTRGIRPELKIVPESSLPEGHAWQAKESEAAIAPAASPPKAQSHLTVIAKTPDWTPEEDARLAEAYALGGRIDLVAAELGRTVKATYSRATKRGLTHPRDIKGGFITRPSWTAAEDQLLRELYGNIPTKDLPGRIGRSKTAIFNRAFALNLKHGYQRQFVRSEIRAIEIGFRRGLSIHDLAVAMGRKPNSLAKYVNNRRMLFGRRPLLAKPITLADILALDDETVALPPFRDRPAEVRAAREADRIERQRAAARERQEREALRSAQAASLRAKRDLEVQRGRRERQAEAMRRIEERRAAKEQRKAAAKTTKTPKANQNCGVEKEAVCRPVAPSPSREPAPSLPLARAQTFRVVPTPGAPRHISYAERMNAAVTFLRGRHFVVRRYDPNEIIGRWQVTGQVGLLDNQELIDLAVHHGLEIAQ